jgi:hypothetical protein
MVNDDGGTVDGCCFTPETQTLERVRPAGDPLDIPRFPRTMHGPALITRPLRMTPAPLTNPLPGFPCDGLLCNLCSLPLPGVVMTSCLYPRAEDRSIAVPKHL